MSRLTSSQIIGLGEYLEPDFEPNSLTVSQLLGILGYHNIRYPTPYTKTKLIQVFNDEVKTRASKFKKERLRKDSSIASDDGITDGLTGKPLSKKEKAPLARRSSRRLSSIPQESSPPQPDPPKRRRSSAQPALGGTASTRRLVQREAVVIEESESEDELPIKKISRTKKKTSAGTQARRVSNVSGEESGWDSNNNIFQSGAESSSPIRPSPVRPRVSRVSGVPRKSRKSMSAPPPTNDSPSPSRPSFLYERKPLSPAYTPFQPQLPELPVYRLPPLTPTLKFSPTRGFSVPVEEQKQETANEPPLDEAENDEVDIIDSQLVEKDSESGADDVSSVSPQESEDQSLVRPRSQTWTSLISRSLLRLTLWSLVLSGVYDLYNYKTESASIGYCEPGSNTNEALRTLLKRREAEEACVRDGASSILHLQNFLNSTLTEGVKKDESCPLPPLIPFRRPSNCTACPEHASCSQHKVTCDSGYLLRPHVLLSFVPVAPSTSSLKTSHAPRLAEWFFAATSALTDGFPGLGSVGLPPRCVEDPKRKRHIGVLGKSIESMLAKERGRRICQGGEANVPTVQADAIEAKRWGIDITKLREHFKNQANASYRDKYDEMFEEAIQQLIQWGGVFIGENDEGQRYVAHKTPDLNWACMVTVKSRELWAAWRSTVLASILSILILLALRVRMTRKQKESRRIAGLVQVALDTLRNQEFAHYTDPLTSPQPYLSSVQLRDLVLQEEHSVPTRRRLWEQVERIVESNANVRANLEETEDGDETRVWRWVGSTGRTPGRKDLE